MLAIVVNEEANTVLLTTLTHDERHGNWLPIWSNPVAAAEVAASQDSPGWMVNAFESIAVLTLYQVVVSALKSHQREQVIGYVIDPGLSTERRVLVNDEEKNISLGA